MFSRTRRNGCALDVTQSSESLDESGTGGALLIECDNARIFVPIGGGMRIALVDDSRRGYTITRCGGTMPKLPKILEREPLVDGCVSEVRLSGTLQLPEILPGFLLHELGRTTKLTRLPAADIPRPCAQITPIYSSHLFNAWSGVIIS